MNRPHLLLLAGILLLVGGTILGVSLAFLDDSSGGPDADVLASTTSTMLQESLPGAAELRRGDLEGARTAIRSHLSQEPGDTQARFLLALTYEREGDLSGALTAYGDLLAEDPRNFEALFRTGNLQRRQNDLLAAAESYDRSLRINSDFTAARVALAEVRAELGDPDAAIDLYFDVIGERPIGIHLDDIRVALARLLLQVGQRDNAEIQLNTALVENPQNESARNLLTEVRTLTTTTLPGNVTSTTAPASP